MRSILTAAPLLGLLALAGCGRGADDGAPVDLTAIGGTYAVERGPDAGCTLDAEPVEKGRLHFVVDCNRGPPSYNMGHAESVIPLAGTEAVYRTEEFGRCEIRFRFTGDEVEVRETSEEGGCGFGFGVYTEGTYHRLDHAPEFLPYP